MGCWKVEVGLCWVGLSWIGFNLIELGLGLDEKWDWILLALVLRLGFDLT